MKSGNPFLTVGYDGPQTFCDRVRETEELLSAIRNGRNVTLIAPRRYGKTGLIHHVMHSLPADYDKVYLDIYATRDLADFVKGFARAIVSSLETRSEKLASVLGRFFGSLRPTMTPQLDGSVKWSFDLAPTMASASLEETFDYLKKRERPLVVAIDEFQQVRKYPEYSVEALFRSHIQFLPNVRFIFAGSQLHLMSDMFVSPRGPFYNSTDILALEVIRKESYRDFAASFFHEKGKAFSDAVFAELYDRFDGITWYVQSVLNRVWEGERGLETSADVESSIRLLVESRRLVFLDLLRSQTEAQQAVLRAVALDGVVSAPTSKDFILRHSLGAASTVSSVVEALVEKELLYRTEKGFIVYDRLFGEWLKNA